MARQCRLGWAGQGEAWLGEAGQGRAGLAWLGMARRGRAWHGEARQAGRGRQGMGSMTIKAKPARRRACLHGQRDRAIFAESRYVAAPDRQLTFNRSCDAKHSTNR